MKIFKYLTNGVILIIIGFMHTHLALTKGGFGSQFTGFAQKHFYKISDGMSELPAKAGITNFESASAFWFFYFGILLIPLGLLAHSIEKEKKPLPNTFIISYLILVGIGAYMIPDSGMTVIMLPHALFMLISKLIRNKRRKQLA